MTFGSTKQNHVGVDLLENDVCRGTKDEKKKKNKLLCEVTVSCTYIRCLLRVETPSRRIRNSIASERYAGTAFDDVIVVSSYRLRSLTGSRCRN